MLSLGKDSNDSKASMRLTTQIRMTYLDRLEKPLTEWEDEVDYELGRR